MVAKAKVYTDTVYFMEDQNIYEVRVFNPNKKLKKEFAYIVGEYILPYLGKAEGLRVVLTPGIYKLTDGSLKFVLPTEEDDKERYNIKNLMDMSYEAIAETDTSNIVSEEDLELLNSSGAIYIPTIKEDDDFLKRAIKQLIIAKGINLKAYKNRFPEGNYSNIRSGLDSEIKMTTPKFITWQEVLGFTFKLVIEDDGTDPYNPLEEPIIIEG